MTAHEGARNFLEAIAGYTDEPAGGYLPSQDRPARIGVVDPAYAGTGPAKVLLDGETVMGTRTYVVMAPVAAGDRVLLVPVGRSYVIMGTLGGRPLARRNLIVNGNFRTSQRGIASGTLLADTQFFFDRWHADYSSSKFRPTWTPAAQGQPIVFGYDSPQTFGLFRQTVERANIIPGDHCLSWVGGGAARIYKRLGSPGSFLGSGQVVNLDGLDDVRVEFIGSTGEQVSKIQLERGKVPTPYEEISIAEELALCQRYFIRYKNVAAYDRLSAVGYQLSTTVSSFIQPVPVPMRTNPTVTLFHTGWGDTQLFGAVATLNGSISREPYSNIYVEVAHSAGGAQFRPGVLRADNYTDAYMDFSAELV